jgi:hypothetical protein
VAVKVELTRQSHCPVLATSSEAVGRVTMLP